MARLHYLSLHQFRNYKKASIYLGPKINLFIGKNGQGKTNCLEAIALLIAGKSFRTSFFKEMILNNEEAFEIQAVFERHDLEQTLSVQYHPQRRRLKHNETVYASLVPLIGLLQGVFFSSYQNALVRGTPSVRRRFLDLQCSQIDPLYLHHLKRYQKALKDRNLFLKQKNLSHLYPYDVLLAQSAPYLIEKRLKALKELEPLVKKHLLELTGQSEPFSFEYLFSVKEMNPLVSHFEGFKTLYEKYRSKDARFGLTHLGPHKDDLFMLLQNLEAKKFASEGQVQSLIHALYFAEYDRLKQASEELPLFCIDDVGQNLDQSRRNKLYQKLEGLGQVFLSTPEMPDYSFQTDVRAFEVKEGTLKALSC